MTKKNKRGWIRILEATMAVLVISSILVVVYTRQPDRSQDASEFVYLMQKEILDDISLNDSLRSAVLSITPSTPPTDPPFVLLESYVESKVSATFEARLRVCELTNPPTPCRLNNLDDIKATRDKDVFVEETIILANLDVYNPKKVKLFVWENR